MIRRKHTILFVLSLTLLIVSCGSIRPVDPSSEQVMKPQKNEDGEWELDVLDSDFNYFLSAIAKPENMYSEEYLKTKNSFLTSEWNNYYYSGKYRNIIESSIDYNPNENYGKHFEYKLFQVFVFVKWKYGLKMNGLTGAY